MRICFQAAASASTIRRLRPEARNSLAAVVMVRSSDGLARAPSCFAPVARAGNGTGVAQRRSILRHLLGLAIVYSDACHARLRGFVGLRAAFGRRRKAADAGP